MTEDPKSKPIDDLKEGLGLLFRAAKGAVETLPTEKVEDVARDAVKEVGKAFENLSNEIDRVWNKATGSEPPPGRAEAHASTEASEAAAKKEEEHFDDAYAPEPPKGPRVG
jgi:hypothetical protein